MRRRLGSFILLLLCVAAPLAARSDAAGSCGVTRETHKQNVFLHRQALRTRTATRTFAAALQSAASANSDIGDTAVIDDAGVVSHVNQFNLNGMTLAFTPSGSGLTPATAQYRYAVSDQGYDSAAATAGAPLLALGDDDGRQVALPFNFPFFGAAYNQVFVNSDGNLTFTAADNASSDRSVGRLSAGPPRVAPLFDDLDPSRTTGGVRVLSDSSRVVVSWVAVPEYSPTNSGLPQTFQVKLYPDGHIEFSYATVTTAIANAVVGIAPGNLAGSTTLLDFRNNASGDYSAAIAEWFTSTQSIDVIAAAQKFYQTHEDSYDYLVIYNSENIPAMGDALAYEDTVRSSGTGYGVDPYDAGQEYGSASRLQAVINMGPLSQYSTDPLGSVPGRPGDTPLSILAHESGHLFLAFASITDPQNSSGQPMLGYQGAHWSFLFDSEASFLEGEQIVDQNAGPLPTQCSGFSPEFMTCATVSHYSPLDQYLMGFRAASDVPGVFLVKGANPAYSPLMHPPAAHVQFDGIRQNISVDDVIGAVGRRTPDSTVAQRRFRFAFILIVPQGAMPGAAQMTQIDTFRQQFESYYAVATDSNAIADTSLKRSMKLSMFPAAGVVAGMSGTATLTLQTPPSADMVVSLQAPNGHATLPSSVTIPAGAATATFTLTGASVGVEEVSATPPAGMPYETAAARVQVAAASSLKLVTISGDNQPSPSGGPLPQPIVVRLTDVNNLSYAGARIVAAASAGGSVSPAAAATDAQGQAAFRWTPGPAGISQLTIALDGAPQVGVTLSGGAAAPVITSVQNAASMAPGMVAGSLAILNGFNLAGGQTTAAIGPWPLDLGGVTVTLNGTPLQIFYASDAQLGVFVPAEAAAGAGTVTVTTPPSSAKTSATVNVRAAQPAIFPGAILIWGTANSAATTPVHAGQYIEIYCTGLGPTMPSGGLQWTVTTPLVFIGTTAVPVLYSGLAPGFVGLYQVDVQIPVGLAPGSQPVVLSMNQVLSNAVNILVQ